MGFQGGGDHHILPEVSYVLEKTFEAVDGGLTFRAVAPLADKMKVLLRQQYNFEFDGQQQGDINNDNGGDISDNENENTL